jgi:hypothetical protein
MSMLEYGFEVWDPKRFPDSPHQQPNPQRGEEHIIRFAVVDSTGRTRVDDPTFRPVCFPGYVNYDNLWKDIAEAARRLLDENPKVERIAAAIGVRHGDKEFFPAPDTWPTVSRRFAHRLADVASGRRTYVFDPH